MIRLLGLLVLIIVVVWLYRHNKAVSARSNPPAKSEDGEKMLSCAKCGVFIPASEAIQKQDQYYCCEQHAR